MSERRDVILGDLSAIRAHAVSATEQLKELPLNVGRVSVNVENVPEVAEKLRSLESQNQALQEALAFYAEPRNHEWQQIEHENRERYTKASSLVDEDAGARARDALSQETEAE